jgi:hypothetical protein
MTTDDEQKQAGDRPPRCDHICLLDDGHVERGESHFYGYEFPPPRSAEAEVRALTARLDALETAASAALKTWGQGWSRNARIPQDTPNTADRLQALLDAPRAAAADPTPQTEGDHGD